MCVHDVFATSLSSFVCHDTVSYYDTNPTSLFINCCAISAFCQHGMHDTTYDTPIVSSLTHVTHLPRGRRGLKEHLDVYVFSKRELHCTCTKLVRVTRPAYISVLI
jgi:hypothetical protein